ncbi:MAG: Hsp20/alpha crystallin family protein, partial [Candidatus Binatia bacterium]
MQLYYWNPMREMAEAQRQFSTLFNEALRREPRSHNGHVTWTPAVDVSETADAYTFTVELPGMNPEAVEVEVKNDTLTIKGERVGATVKEGERYYHQE